MIVMLFLFEIPKENVFEAVEVLTADTKYLVKISEKLEYTMENYDATDYEDFDDDDPTAVVEPDPEDMVDGEDDED